MAESETEKQFQRTLLEQEVELRRSLGDVGSARPVGGDIDGDSLEELDGVEYPDDDTPQWKPEILKKYYYNPLKKQVEETFIQLAVDNPQCCRFVNEKGEVVKATSFMVGHLWNTFEEARASGAARP